MYKITLTIEDKGNDTAAVSIINDGKKSNEIETKTGIMVTELIKKVLEDNKK